MHPRGREAFLIGGITLEGMCHPYKKKRKDSTFHEITVYQRKKKKYSSPFCKNRKDEAGKRSEGINKKTDREKKNAEDLQEKSH